MKRLAFLILLFASALVSKAQSAIDKADEAFNKKDYAKAGEYYGEVVKTEPGNIKAYRRAGFCFMNVKGQELNSTPYFLKAIELNPSDMASTNYLGLVYTNASKDPANAAKKAELIEQAKIYLSKAAEMGSDAARETLKTLAVN